MRIMVAMLAALICASCGGGAASTSSTDPSPSSDATASSTPSTSASAPSTTPPPATSASGSSPSPVYEVVEIPRLAATGSVTANAVNSQGVVVGEIETTTAPRAWMFQSSSGALSELSFDPSEDGAAASGISDNGTIAGAQLGPPVPGFWTTTGGSMLLTGPYQSFAEAVAANDNGTIIGNYQNSGAIGSLPLVWTAPGYAQSTLPGLECDNCNPTIVTANAINDAGLIVGSSSYATSNTDGTWAANGTHAVEWQDGDIADLSGLQGGDSAAYAVNSSGDVAGSSRTSQADGAPTHAVLFHQGAITDLGTLAGDLDSAANSINDSGQVVGVSADAADTQRAFLYQNGRMYDLNSLIGPSSALAGLVSLQDAVSISANGWIAVNGTDSRDPGWTRAFLLIPSS